MLVGEIRITQEVRAGDPFHARGARLLARIFSGEDCSECGQSIDVYAGGGVVDGEEWRCDDCATYSPKEVRSR